MKGMSMLSTHGEALCMIILSICTFYFTNAVLWIFLAPISARKTVFTFWRWKNLMNSMTHALITSVGSLSCLLLYPQMAEDLINTHNSYSYRLIAFSFGYFLSDAFDLLRNYKSRHTCELLLHHTFIYLAFGTALYSKLYIGYAVVSLIVEVNSVFLHIRQIFILLGYPKDSRMCRINSLINIGTFIVFRMLTLVWMTRWLVIHRDDVPAVHYTIGSVGLASIIIISIILLMRLLSKDFVKANSNTQVVRKIE